MNALELLIINASTSDYFQDYAFKVKAGTTYKSVYYFSDSVYFFADTNLDIGTQVDLLSVKCASLIAAGFSLGFLVRAGIAVGDLRSRIVSLYNGDKSLVSIGRSMAKAHILQESQEWIGGAVESEFPKGAKEINRVNYDVPIKDKKKFTDTKLEAINWVYILASGINGVRITKDEVIDKVQNSILKLNGSESETIKAKLENTMRFVEYIYSQPEYISDN